MAQDMLIETESDEVFNGREPSEGLIFDQPGQGQILNLIGHFSVILIPRYRRE